MLKNNNQLVADEIEIYCFCIYTKPIVKEANFCFLNRDGREGSSCTPTYEISVKHPLPHAKQSEKRLKGGDPQTSGGAKEQPRT